VARLAFRRLPHSSVGVANSVHNTWAGIRWNALVSFHQVTIITITSGYALFLASLRTCGIASALFGHQWVCAYNWFRSSCFVWFGSGGCFHYWSGSGVGLAFGRFLSDLAVEIAVNHITTSVELHFANFLAWCILEVVVYTTLLWRSDWNCCFKWCGGLVFWSGCIWCVVWCGGLVFRCGGASWCGGSWTVN